MPKEVIVEANNNVVTVGWTKDQEAQVGVSIGRSFRIDDIEFDTLYATLTRREDFNHLIRALQRARNAVCGKDA